MLTKYEDIKNMPTLDIEAQLEKETKMLIDFVEKEFNRKVIDIYTPIKPGWVECGGRVMLMIEFEDHYNFQKEYSKEHPDDLELGILDYDIFLKCDPFIRLNNFLVIDFVTAI